jgi:hypothetical protein
VFLTVFRYIVYGIQGTKEGKGVWKWDADGVSTVAATKAQEVEGEITDKDWGALKDILKKDNPHLVYV